MIQVQHLTKHYGTARAVQNLTFSVEEGDILGLLGPNGAGKSTTMRILTCYTPPTSGGATINGLDIRKDSFEVRRTVGYLPESTPLYLDMTVRGYLRFMAELKGIPAPNRRKAVNEAIEETGLGSVSGRLIRNLSKGYRQRVGLAQALVGDPRVLILDEPTVGLDPRQIREIRSLIRDMRGRRTVLLSTHILPEVSMTCNRVVIINNGRIEAAGTPENLVGELQTTVETRVVVQGEPEALERAVRAVDGVLSCTVESSAQEGRFDLLLLLDRAKEARPAVARAILQAGGDLYDFRTQGMSLEDVFLKVVSRGQAESAREDDHAA